MFVPFYLLACAIFFLLLQAFAFASQLFQISCVIMASPGAKPYFPPGYLQEYSGDQSIRVAIAFIVLEVLIVMARFYARTKNEAPLG